MGTYYIISCPARKEYIHPHAFDMGMKLREFIYRESEVCLALAALMSGRWHGERVHFLGDDIDPHNYGVARKDWQDISREIIAELEEDWSE